MLRTVQSTETETVWMNVKYLKLILLSRKFSYYLAEQTLPSLSNDQSISAVRKIIVVYYGDRMTQFTPWANVDFFCNSEAGRTCNYHCALRGPLTQPFHI
jgi:hypothetical protein